MGGGLFFFLKFSRKLVAFETIWNSVKVFLPLPLLKRWASLPKGGHAPLNQASGPGSPLPPVARQLNHNNNVFV